MKGPLSQILLRLPRQLHQDIKEAAETEGLSLNQYCLYLLARHTASKEAQRSRKAESLLQFLAQAQTLQKEFEKSKKEPEVSKELPLEIPQERYRHLHGRI